MITKQAAAITVLWLVCALSGCQRDAAPLRPGNSGPLLQEPDNLKPEVDETGHWQTITDLYENAKDSGETTAASAKDWIAELYESAKFSGETMATDSSEWVNEMYQQARDAGETSATSAKEWVVEDVRQIGSWQYKTLQTSKGDAADIEAQLNELGVQRWECFWVDKQDDMVTFYLKKAGRSYLRHLPTKELIRMVPLLGGDES